MSSMSEVVVQIAADNLIGPRDNGRFIYASCPFHSAGRAQKTPSFWISKSTGAYGCWSCSASGKNAVEFLKAVGGKAGATARGIIRQAQEETRKNAKYEQAKKKREAVRGFKAVHKLPANELLPIYNSKPESLISQGFDVEVLQDHNIGFDQHNQRLTFPIFDIEGDLVGISGRNTSGYGPKYKVYTGKHLNGDGVMVPGELGEWYPYYSADDVRNHLWRADKVYPRVMAREEGWDYIIIVEGYKAALWMVQHGYLSTVAIMGARMSRQQARIVRRMGVRTFVFLDNNQAGRDGSEDICFRLGDLSAGCYEVTYDPIRESVQNEEQFKNLQPDDLEEEAIAECLRLAIPQSRLSSRLRWRMKQWQARRT